MNFNTESLENRVQYLRNFLNDKESEDKIAAVNVSLMLQRGKIFSNDFFNDESVIFNDIVEMVDIKESLELELNKFISEMLGIYLACVKHCSDFNDNHPKKKMPNNCKLVLLLMDINNLSMLFDEHNAQDDDSKYEDAFGIISHLVNQYYFYNNFLTSTFGSNEETK